jgi:hypothetical protein
VDELPSKRVLTEKTARNQLGIIKVKESAKESEWMRAMRAW